MSESNFVDKRGIEKPERKLIPIYPRCGTCRNYEQFVFKDGTLGGTVCVLDPPKTLAQIRGEDKQGNVVWSSWHGFPVVTEFNRCSRHVAVESN